MSIQEGSSTTTTTTTSMAMKKWFETKPSDKCDALASLQLDYRFAGDNLGSVWWIHFQTLGFTHTGVKYELPLSAPMERRPYEPNEMYEIMDSLAIPQLSSTLENVPSENDCAPLGTNHTLLTQEEKTWWRQIRDELIFLKCHEEIEQREMGRQRGGKPKMASRPFQGKPSNKRKNLVLSSDAGAELYMGKAAKKKGKSSQKSAKAESSDTNMSMTFPTIRIYASKTRQLNLAPIEEREQEYSTLFQEWRFWLTMNHSILFYGVGSKRTLLNRFANEELEKDGDVLIIDGFDKNVNIDGILEIIVEKWLGNIRPTHNRYDVHTDVAGKHMYPIRGDASVVQQAISIGKALARSVVTTLRPLHMVLHNIDGVALRNPTAQEALSALVFHSTTKARVGMNGFRLIASVDHVNAPAVLWDTMTMARFRWVWQQVHTHRPYIEEITESMLPDNLIKASRRQQTLAENTTLDSIFSVLKSLAPRHAEAFKLLAKLQLRLSQEWIDYKDLRTECTRTMTITQDSQLRNMLRELLDHGAVEKNDNYYRIPYMPEDLKTIIAFDRKDYQNEDNKNE